MSAPSNRNRRTAKPCAPNLDGIAVKIKRSLQGSPVENTHKSVVRDKSNGISRFAKFSFFCWKLQKCKNTKMRKCAPQWPFRTREMVPTHPPGCVLTWSNLDPRISAISEPPGQLMATRGLFMAIWTVFGHKMGKNGWIKSMSIWIKTLLNPTDNLHSLVFTKRQLRNSPPP